jgi:hypothetical protein
LAKQLEDEGVAYKSLFDDDDIRESTTEIKDAVDAWDDPIWEDLDKLNPRTERSLGQKERSAIKEFVQAMEDDYAGIYLADLARHGAVKGE